MANRVGSAGSQPHPAKLGQWAPPIRISARHSTCHLMEDQLQHLTSTLISHLEESHLHLLRALISHLVDAQLQPLSRAPTPVQLLNLLAIYSKGGMLFI